MPEEEEKKTNKKRRNTSRTDHHTSLNNAQQKINELEESISQQKKINEILQETISHYRTISEILHDAIFIVDNEGFVQYVNCAAADLLKSKAGNIIGKPLKTLFPAESYEIQKRNLDKVFNDKSPFYSEDKIVFPGAEIWLDTHLIPIKDKKGNISAVLGIARNTTERKNLGSDITYARGLPSDSRPNPDTDKLTKREKEILRLIASGMTNKQIAENLCISVKTVDTHRTRMMKKIKAHNTASLVRFAINTGLL
jgi:PAS domain S-box-containing protein